MQVQISAIPASEKLRCFSIFFPRGRSDSLDDVADLLELIVNDDVRPTPAFFVIRASREICVR
jgi:hypothetical protein